MKLFRSFLLVSACLLCSSVCFSLVVHQVGVVDPENCATITYPGTSRTMVVNLFKVNGQVRSGYLDKTLLGSYNQIGSLGFSVQVPAGQNTLEIIHLKRKEIVTIAANFENKEYRCDFSDGYEIFETDQDGNRKQLELTVTPVLPYAEAKENAATLHADIEKKHSPVIFRVNGFAPADLGRKGWNNYYFNNPATAFDLGIPEGTNVVELSINTTTSGYSGHKYLIVQRIEFTAVKGKTYAITLHEAKVGKITTLTATVDER